MSNSMVHAKKGKQRCNGCFENTSREEQRRSERVGLCFFMDPEEVYDKIQREELWFVQGSLEWQRSMLEVFRTFMRTVSQCWHVAEKIKVG